MADKRPQEEKDGSEKTSQKKDEESHASLLKKGIAERVTQFLNTHEGKTALGRGKDFFMKQFLLSWEKSDADAFDAYKALIGKKSDDELTLKDLADIRITYEDSFESYLNDAERAQFTNTQEKAVAQTFLQKMDAEVQGKHFDQPQRDIWNQYVSSKKDAIQSRADLQRYLKEFFLKAGVIITPEQKKRLGKISVELRDIAGFMTEQSGFEKEATTKLRQKEIIVANTDIEDMVKRFLRTYVATEVAPAYETYQKGAQEMAAIYKVPGFQRVLEGFDLSAETLAKNDKAFSDIYNDGSASQEKKNAAQKKAIVSALAKKDAELSDIVGALFENNFNLARLTPAQQQMYVNRFQDLRSNSKDMKTFDELFTKIGADVSDRKDLMKQIFDLSKNELRVKGKDGQAYTIPLQKKIIDRPWSGETMSETLAHEMPLAFLLSPDKNLDDDYIRALTHITEKGFSLKDSNGKDITLYPGHLVEITTKDNKKHKGYIYKDPEGNIILSQQPGSSERVTISADEAKSSTAKIAEQTYSLNPQDIPTLLGHIALMRETAARSDEKNREVLNERNQEIAEETIKESYEAPKPLSQPVTDEEIDAIDEVEPEVIDDLDAQKREEMKKHIEKRMKDFSKRIDKTEKNIKEQEALIQSLNQELKIAGAKKKLAPEQLSALQGNLQSAKEERDRLIDEKNELADKLQKYQGVQKKIQERTQQEKNQQANEKNNRDGDVGVAKESIEKEGDFLHDRAELNGDKTLSEPQKGKTCLMILLPDASSSTGGGGGAWVRADVVGYDADTHTIQIKRHGVEAPLKNLEGQVGTIHGVEGLRELKRTVSKVYKFKKYDTISQRGIDLKGGISTGEEGQTPDNHFHFDKKYEGRCKHLKDDIDFSSMVSQKTKQPIKYFGKKVGGERVRYEIDQSSGGVKVKELKLEDKKDEKGKPTSKELKVTYKKEMPINDFMMFAMEKDLRGYTQQDVDDANGGNEDANNKGNSFIYDRVDPAPQGVERKGGGLFGLRRGNIAGVKSSRDLITKGIKTHFEEKTKKGQAVIENSMLTSKWFKSLEKLPIVGGAFDDIRGGIESKLDNDVKKKINEYKDEVGTKKDTSSNGGSDFIKAVLTDKEARENPAKAAGYYLFALEQGNPYFRSLKDFRGTGRWVGKILGPTYQKQYVAYIKNLENELAKNPTSKELNNDLSMGELGFMQKTFNEGRDNGQQDDLKKLLGNRFFTGGLGQAQYSMWYNSAKIDETVKNEGAKPFHQLFGDSRTGWYEAGRINDVLGVLKLLSEKVGSNEDYYYKRAGSMFMPLMNGQYRTDMSPSYKSIYQQIARKNAFPFAAYMTEGNGTEKVQELFDIASDGSLSKAFADEPTTDKSGKKLSEVAIRTSAFKSRWEKNGREALDRLQNPKELFAKKKELEGQVSDQAKLNQYNTLTDYVKNKYNDEDRNSISEQIDGESIIYQKNIFSAPSGFVKEQMLNFSNGQFKGRSEKNGPELWEALKAKLNDINNASEGEMSPDFFALILKRYFSMFHTKYNGTSKRAFIGALKYPDLIPEIFQLNVRGVFDKKFGGNDLPGEVEDSLVIFENIFRKFAPLVRKNPEMLEGVFDDPRMVDYFKDMTQEDMRNSANTLKNIQAKLKERAALGELYDDDDSLFGMAA